VDCRTKAPPDKSARRVSKVRHREIKRPSDFPWRAFDPLLVDFWPAGVWPCGLLSGSLHGVVLLGRFQVVRNARLVAEYEQRIAAKKGQAGQRLLRVSEAASVPTRVSRLSAVTASTVTVSSLAASSATSQQRRRQPRPAAPTYASRYFQRQQVAIGPSAYRYIVTSAKEVMFSRVPVCLFVC